MADIKFSQFAAGGNVKVGDIVVGLRDADNAKFTFPGTGFSDADGNFILGYSTSGGGSINHLFIENAAATFAPELSARGTDTNIDLQISSKGTGSVLVNTLDIDSVGNISGIVSAIFPGSSSGSATLLAQAAAGTPTLQLPNTSGILALASAIPALPLSLANGGTGASLTASNGGIFYSNATTGAILSGTATADRVLLSGSSSAPSWSVTTYPSTTTINRLLYSSSNDVVGQVTAANSAVLVSGSTGVPVWSNTMTNGQIIIGSTGAQPQAASITAGAGISITPGAASLTIAATAGGGGLVWSTIAGTSQSATVNTGWIPQNVGLTTITLPSTAAIGSFVSIQGQGSGGWLIDAPGTQIIRIGSSPTSAGGTVSSANRYDAITLVCIVADTEWAMYGPVSSGFVIT
jgi:hypothetical protein